MKYKVGLEKIAPSKNTFGLGLKNNKIPRKSGKYLLLILLNTESRP